MPAVLSSDLGSVFGVWCGHMSIYSLTASCKLCEVEAFEYIRDVLEPISTHPASRIAELMPLGWKEYFTVHK